LKEKKHSDWKIRRLRDVTELPQARTALYAAFDKHGQLNADRAAVFERF